MKNYVLDDDEKLLLKDIEAGKYKTVANIREEIKKAREYAKNTVNKKKNINLRLSIKDLEKIKVKAIAGGLPYQTLAASVLHHYANEKISLNI
jgi:predicted DNA binding CopG/RHH family protein